MSHDRLRLWEEILLALRLAFSAVLMSSKGTEIGAVGQLHWSEGQAITNG